MRDCIVRMPDSLMTLLTSVNRADCVDFREAGMEAKVTNRLGGTTELTQLTADYALWQYTSASQVEMKLLPLTDSTSVICLVRTVQLPAPDSRIAFYDEAWAPLPLSRFIQLASPEQHAEPVANHFTRRLLPMYRASVAVWTSSARRRLPPRGRGTCIWLSLRRRTWIAWSGWLRRLRRLVSTS